VNRVVLPAPFGPITDVIVPRSTVREAPLTAFRPPNAIDTFSTSRILFVLIVRAPSLRAFQIPLVGA